MGRYWLVAVACLAVACGDGGGVTGPDSGTSVPDLGTASAAGNPEEPASAVEPAEEEGAPGCEFTGGWPVLTVDCSPVRHDVNKRVHFFRMGPHPQQRIGAGFYDFTVAPRAVLAVNLEEQLAVLVGECGEFDGEIQWDVTHQSTPVDARSDQLGHIFAWGHPVVSIQNGGPECEPTCTPENWTPECGEAPCEDEPVLLGEEIVDTREGVCAQVMGEWGPLGCQRVDSLLVRKTWKQCDMLWTTEEWERSAPVSCECEPEVEDAGLCHVSNTGTPHAGDVELRVQWKRAGEAGHDGHCADFPATIPELSASGQSYQCEVKGPNADRCSCDIAIQRWAECTAGGAQ